GLLIGTGTSNQVFSRPSIAAILLTRHDTTRTSILRVGTHWDSRTGLKRAILSPHTVVGGLSQIMHTGDNMPARFPEIEVHGPVEAPHGVDVPLDLGPLPNPSPRWNIKEEVVISGISGRLPESGNIDEFRDQLFAGVDLVTEDERRWPSGLFGLPTRTGKLKDLAHFDASFFGVHAKQAHVMDPQLRMLLELTHEAIVDAELKPAHGHSLSTNNPLSSISSPPITSSPASPLHQ
ncbi:unnamed protein product, partial [Timema podura]|nr:unnamed protein product [Timema podura]